MCPKDILPNSEALAPHGGKQLSTRGATVVFLETNVETLKETLRALLKLFLLPSKPAILSKDIGSS